MPKQSHTSEANAHRRVLITGGTGSVGTAFIKTYAGEFDFYSTSRGRSDAVDEANPQVDARSYRVDVRDLDALKTVFCEVKPDVVIHAAALKAVNLAEVQPSLAIEINVVGTLNVIKACMHAAVPVAVAISTDKACQPENIYGYSKKITEQIWLEHHSNDTRFVCARLANVAGSAGSVIPIWLKSAFAGETLKLTDSRMNRLMFSAEEASELVRKTADYAHQVDAPFVLVRKMKSVNMLQLANAISADFGDGRPPETIGLRPGERLNETLVSDAELDVAYEADDGLHIMLHSDAIGQRLLKRELSSLTAEYMSDEEIRALYDGHAKKLLAAGAGTRKRRAG
ncbi:MAG: polysaccharide biosynthesis protein [Pseudomonadota bacterium]